MTQSNQPPVNRCSLAMTILMHTTTVTDRSTVKCATGLFQGGETSSGLRCKMKFIVIHLERRHHTAMTIPLTARGIL